MQTFYSALGDFSLERIPQQNNSPLLAWDAADELLINYIHDNQLIATDSNVLIVNDQFGTLATTLSSINDINISSWSDSYISQLATIQNIDSNHRNNTIDFIKSSAPLNKRYDLVLIKLPKTTALLVQQLNGLCAHLNDNGVIIAAGMCKHMPKSTYAVFEKYIGQTQTSHAKKKARLIFAKNDNIKKQVSCYPIVYHEANLKVTLRNHANVFSKKSLDIGSRFFIEHFDKLPIAENIIDLGCGNGVLGIMAHKKQGNSKIHFIDESFMALQSAEENFDHIFPHSNKACYYTSECLSQAHAISADLILCNPPFHQQHSISDQIAWRMFQHSYKQLQTDGELWVIANRHMGYHIKLSRLFGNCKTIASNHKFVILLSKKSDK